MNLGALSLSARRAWIEIDHHKRRLRNGFVALRKESVDRNLASPTRSAPGKVALRKESVDRNRLPRCGTARDMVALRKESVDRNIFADASKISKLGRSPQGERG